MTGIGAVGHDRDRVGHPGVVLGQRRVGRDRLADERDPGGVRQRQVVGTAERHRRDGLQLAADVQVEDRLTGVRVGCCGVGFGSGL
jgi:hypothetical protein